VLPGHPLVRHIDDFLADLANANKPRNTIRAYRGDLIAFAAHHNGDIAGLTWGAPARAGAALCGRCGGGVAGSCGTSGEPGALRGTVFPIVQLAATVPMASPAAGDDAWWRYIQYRDSGRPGRKVS
jgi:hypothetical protein